MVDIKLPDEAWEGTEAGAEALLDAWLVAAGSPSEGHVTTVARDGRGRWWVAYNWQRGMFVRHSTDSTVGAWSAPIAVSTAKAAAESQRRRSSDNNWHFILAISQTVNGACRWARAWRRESGAYV